MSELWMLSSLIIPKVIDWTPSQTLLRNNPGQVVHIHTFVNTYATISAMPHLVVE